MTVGSGGASSTDIGAGGAVSSEIGAGGARPCIDTSNDPDNCGKCGNVCGTVRLANKQLPGSIAIDATSVYWANGSATTVDGGALMKVSREGGEPVTVVSGQDVGRIALDAASVYFTSPSRGKVMKVAKSGGTPTVLASTPNPIGIAIDADNVYWTSYSNPNCPESGGPCAPDGAVMKAPIAGGDTTPIASHLERVGSIAVDGTNVYWTVPGRNVMNGAVFRAPRAGGAPVALATHQWDVRDELVVSTSNVYWIQASQADGGGGNALVTVPIKGGTVTEIAHASGPLATDGTSIYFFDQNGIMKRPFAGGAPVFIASAQPAAMAVDAANIYWSNQLMYDGSVMTLTAPSCSAGQCACPAKQSLCMGSCIDLKTDGANCGACGNTCPHGVSCTNGHCGA